MNNSITAVGKKYLDTKQKIRHLKPNTIIKYQYYLDLISSKLPHCKEFSAITPLEIESAYIDLLEKHSRNTVHQVHQFLRNLFEYAYIRQYIKVDPMRLVMSPVGEQTKVQFLSADQVATLRSYMRTQSIKWQTYVDLCLRTSRRRGEITALRYKDLVWKNDQFQIHWINNLQYDAKNGIYVTTRKCKEDTYDILPESTWHLIRQLGKEYCKKRESNGAWNPDGYIFTQRSGKPMHPDSPTRYLTKVGKKLGMKITPHILRHTLATLMVEYGSNDYDICRQLNHKQVTTTRRYYIHLDYEPSISTRQLIDRMFTD